jgi:hypothetical protein
MKLEDILYKELLELKMALYEDEINGQKFLEEIDCLRNRFLVDFTIYDWHKLSEMAEEEFNFILYNESVKNPKRYSF